jgi:hypothetical protein
VEVAVHARLPLISTVVDLASLILWSYSASLVVKVAAEEEDLSSVGDSVIQHASELFRCATHGNVRRCDLRPVWRPVFNVHGRGLLDPLPKPDAASVPRGSSPVS